ncbi:MAG: endopeptidase La [Deltaproteobacteria bacterium]|nr:endopeptidase La [Deltaproteobacteria bacterium]MCB9489229.1 endopeptidase La [Deltaproteobacteria bacterium]
MAQDKPAGDSEKRRLPLLPLRDIIIFPQMVMPLFVGREKSIAALEEAMAQDKDILLAAQEVAKFDAPRPEDIYHFGTIGSIIQLLKLPDGTVKVLVEGRRRARIEQFISNDDFFLVECVAIEEPDSGTVEIEALTRSVQATFEQYVKLNKRIPQDVVMNVAAMDDPSRLADTIATHLNMKLHDKQEILETIDVRLRLERIYGLMRGEIEVMQVERKIKNRVKKQVERTQKEYYLNEQMRAIQKELGERGEDMKSDLKELEEKIAAKKMSEEAHEKVRAEFKKLRMMSPMSAEATVVRSYIETVIGLPWYDMADEINDIDHAEDILNEDHFGLEKVKERIIEYLAVNKLVGKIKGPILCLAGPPGVGKTSLGKSVARATGRPFVRLALGGVRDEAEIRGHRRTYIGSMPGKILQSLRKAGVNNPVFLLDEVDKMSHDYRGDPSSALLEVLDPEQNHTFNDHYLDLDYDLSNIMFVTTANDLYNIPEPLKDRMEIIQLPGYTEHEKFFIATEFLIKKQFENNGLADKDVTVSNTAVYRIIREYTREAGVRELERQISAVARKVARQITRKDYADKAIRITAQSVPKYLGVPKYKKSELEDTDMTGLAVGLAWTQAGGDVLPVEVAVMPGGKGKIVITGKLGDVMQESAQTALSYVRSRAHQLGLSEHDFHKLDIHIHVPEGAIPKDGPSAGITLATSIASALMHIPVRRDVAMTGEITLRGRVLPIGGLKEKVIAAHRTGVKTVLIPRDNEKDLKEIPEAVRKAVKMVMVDHVDDVLKKALAVDDPESLFTTGRALGLDDDAIADPSTYADQTGELI